MPMRKRVPTPRLVVYVLLALLVPTVALPQSTTGKSEVYEQLNLFGEAFERIRQDAVEPVGDKRLIETAISGMLAALDPNCVYLTEDEYKALQVGAEGQTGSIGLVVTLDGGQVKVVSPRDGSPAAQAGLKPGEQIFEIDRKQVFDLTLSQIEAKLHGPIDSEVTLTLRGDNGKPLYVTMKRVADKWPSVASRLEGGDVGYIRIAGFDDGTQPALTAAVQDLAQQAGNKLVGYVLDLRNDPGGNFDVALKVADDFLDKGDIAVIKGRKSDGTKTIPATPGDITGALPIVALVNGGTASEAELVAAALQDNHRAVLVGTKTFGESAIETLIPLDGNGAIKLTTARFLTPGGHAIQGKGLAPDVVVAPVKLERIAQGFGQREVDLPGALKNTDPVAPAPAAGNPPPPAPAPPASSAAPGPASPPEAAAAPPEKHDTRSSVTSGELGGSQDEQLTQALDMLRGLAMVTARNGQ
jgi:carboxyl-terminal processing protease